MKAKTVSPLSCMTNGEKVFKVFCYAVLFCLTLVFLLPVWVTFAASFVSEQESIQRGAFILIPRKFDFSAYKLLLAGGSYVYSAYKITILRTVLGTGISLFLTVLTAYGISKTKLPGITAFSGMMFFTMLFGGGLIPFYLIVSALGLRNTIWALVIPSAINTWYVFVMRNFFMQLPESLEEAAMIDGAGVLKTLFTIIIPLSLPSLSTIGLFYAVSQWNSWFDASLYLDDMTMMPVQIILRNIVNRALSMSDTMVIDDLEYVPPSLAIRSTMIVITTLPILLVYPFLQKYFISGLTVGAVKG